MFADKSLVSTRETAAVLALMSRRVLPWNRLAGAIEEEGSALGLLESRSQVADQLFEIEDGVLTLDQLEEQLLAWEEEAIEVATVLDSSYPVNLRMVHDRPPALFVRGQLRERDAQSVAVVGTRKATADALASARGAVAELVNADYVVVSGLAAGIDTEAHTTALELGGRTIAVIGTGLHHVFPRANAELQDRLTREGAVVSQFWPSQEPRRWTFPQRNAVMSGLARATVVVEASHTSGARMQARLALEHGRPVFLLRRLLEHSWARAYSDRPGVYVVEDGIEVVRHLERLYAAQMTLVR